MKILLKISSYNVIFTKSPGLLYASRCFSSIKIPETKYLDQINL